MALSFSAILFLLVPGTFGEVSEAPSASLLQAAYVHDRQQGHQEPPQNQQEVAQVASQMLVPQAQAQWSQPSTALASVGVPNTYVQPPAVTPGSPEASMQAPVAPNQAVLVSSASRVKSGQAAQMNETALAFNQLSSLDTEFKELHADDASHVRQLTYNVHLREQLKEQLRQAEEQLMQDNEALAERTMQIIASAEDAQQPQGQASQASVASAENGGNESFAALLLEAAVTSRRNRELNNAQIAAQALDRVKALVTDIAALRAKDEEEMQALRSNAQGREALRKKMEQRSDQLHQDAMSLSKDLGQIRDLVAKDETTFNGAGVAVDEASASSNQEPTKAEATSNA